MRERLLELLTQLPGELLLELTLLLVGTFILWTLTPIVNQVSPNMVQLPRFVQLAAAGVRVVFNLLLPLAFVIWFATIPFRYL